MSRSYHDESQLNTMEQVDRKNKTESTQTGSKFNGLAWMSHAARVSASLLPDIFQEKVSSPSFGSKNVAYTQVVNYDDDNSVNWETKSSKTVGCDDAQGSSVALRSYQGFLRQASIKSLHHVQQGSKLFRRGNTFTNISMIEPEMPNTLSKESLASDITAVEPSPELKDWKARILAVNLGLPLMLVNTFLGCITSIAAKMLTSWSPSYPTFELIFMRSIAMSTVAILWLRFREPWTGFTNAAFGARGSRFHLFLRSCFGFLSVSMYYISVRHLSASEAVVISFTSPIFVGIAGWVILKESWELIDASAAIISLLGVAIIAKPDILPFALQATYSPRLLIRSTIMVVTSLEQQRLIAIGFGIGSAMCGSGTFIILRQLRSISPVQITATFGIYSIGFALLGALAFEKSMSRVLLVIPSTWTEVFLLIPMMSLAGLVAQVCLSVALRYEKPSKCTTINSMQIVFSFAAEILLRGVFPRLTDLIGGGIIVSSVLLVGITKWRKERRAAAAAALASKLKDPYFSSSHYTIEDSKNSESHITKKDLHPAGVSQSPQHSKSGFSRL